MTASSSGEADVPRGGLSAEAVRLLAEAAGVPVAPDRLPAVLEVLAELFSLEGALDNLDLTGIDPDADLVAWSEARR